MSQCGYIAVVGRPNVGKSTLMNHILGQKISITSRKAQTTRHQVLGIKTENDIQAIFVDTPGMHQGTKKQLNRMMNRAADSVLHETSVIIFIVEAGKWREEDDWIIEKFRHVKAPIILAINKIDKLKSKNDVLPFLEMVQSKYDFSAVIPVSALQAKNLDTLEAEAYQYLPEAPHVYGEDEITNRSVRFLVSEIIREKLFRLTGDEIPHSTAVEIELYQDEEKITRIAAVILVERKGQKPIVIGSKGERLKRVGQQARLEIQELIGRKVFLQLWVKIKDNWSDDARMLKSLGYDD
tara:strand:- start:13219 stop:14103 length:885 start_codon:yes stop_codon:yes gene_type:complete